MSWFDFSKLVAVTSLIFFGGGLIYHYYKTKQLRFPVDFARPKGSYKIGVIYSFTIGMMPWVKESTRKHWIAYLRGVIFHIGIFIGIAVLILNLVGVNINSSFVKLFAIIVGLGAIMGFSGIFMRIFEKNLRKISTVDDFISVLLVSLFLTFVALSLVNSKFSSLMYFTSGLTFFYAPVGKIKHCLYFFFSRFFFGVHLGRRGIVHKYTEVLYGE